MISNIANPMASGFLKIGHTAIGSDNLGRLSSGLRINGQIPEKTEPADASQAFGPAAAEAVSEEVPENQPWEPVLAPELLDRLLEANPADRTAAELLAESLTAAAQEIKNSFGREKADEFLAQILKATEAGVSEPALTNAAADFFARIKTESFDQPALLKKLEEMKSFLNGGLELALEPGRLEDKLQPGEVPGLSLSLNNYFGHEPVRQEDSEKAELKAFNLNFEWVGTIVEPKEEELPFGGFFVVFSGSNVKSSDFTVSQELLDQITGFLREDIGSENAAACLEQGAAADFLASVTTAIAIVSRENGQEAAQRLTSFLNDKAAPSVRTASIQLEGWYLSRDYGQPDAPVPQRPAGRLILADGEKMDEIIRKQHQGAVSNWKDKNGVTSEVTLDLNDLYDIYLANFSPKNSDNASNSVVNNVKGGFIDNIV
jgi:hypothetical protein